MSNTCPKKFKTIDLFAGIGGIRLGLEGTGAFETVFANDYDVYCKTTYDLNFPKTPLYHKDIKDLDVDSLPEFDFLLGGFPCQPFSVAGYRQGFGDNKGRGDLFFYIAKILEKKRPWGFMLENVKNLAGHNKGKTLKIILETLRELGYAVKYEVLNGMTHGNLPQNRERVYIVGFRDPHLMEKFRFPGLVRLEKKVSDLLEPEHLIDERYYYNGKPLFEKIKSDINEKGVVYQWRRKYVRKNKSNVCPTLTANMGTGGHNVPIILDDKGIRKLTPRECLRLQGFPEEYILPDIAISRLYKQIGNSVNVPVVKRIAKKILIALS